MIAAMLVQTTRATKTPIDARPHQGRSGIASVGSEVTCKRYLSALRPEILSRLAFEFMQGLMQDVPLNISHLFDRAERYHPHKELVTATVHGRERTNYGEWATRTRQLGGVLDALEISEYGRVATFSWNTAQHLELYFAAPCTGRVCTR